jgi:hypothetical protein
MTEKEIHTILSQNPIAARIAASDFLYSLDVRDAWKAKRIVDHETGRAQRHFTANGNKYTIYEADAPLSLQRQTKLRQLVVLAGYDMTLSDLTRQLNEMRAKIDAFANTKTGIFDLATQVQSMLQSIANAKRDYNFSIWACTTFVLREGESLTEYDEQLAAQKVEDWNTEGIHPADFFFLALQQEAQLNELSSKLLARLL